MPHLTVLALVAQTLLFLTATALPQGGIATVTVTQPAVHTTTTTVATATPTGGLTLNLNTGPYSADNIKSQVLDTANYFRGLFSAKPLVWDDQLASYAQNYSQGCEWVHSGGPYSEVYGQNLATPALDIASWIAEEKYYNYVKA